MNSPSAKNPMAHVISSLFMADPKWQPGPHLGRDSGQRERLDGIPTRALFL